MADLIQISPEERDLGRIVSALRAVIERFPASEDAAAAATPTSTQIISGAGLTGGGDLSANRTLAVGAGTGLTVNADDVGLSNMAQATVKGRASGAGTGAPTDLVGSDIRTIAGLEYGLQTIWVPAGGMTPHPSTPAGQSTYTNGSYATPTFDFDQTNQEAVVWSIAMPKSWDKLGVICVPYWTATGGTGTVAWAFAGVAISDDDSTNPTSSSSVTTTDTLLAANDLHIAPATSGLVVDGSAATDDMVWFILFRLPGSDTLNADARLIGVKLLYTVNAGNDT